MPDEKKAYASFDSAKRAEWERRRLPYQAEYELTAHCNFSCVHCYLQKQHSRPQASTEEVLSTIDLMADKGILFLTLTGGEILCRRDFAEIYMHAKRRGILVELFTNAALFTDEIIAMLAKYPPLLIEISLYGACEETYRRVTGVDGAFGRVMENLEKLRAANVRFMLKSPILTLTLDEVDAMRAIADGLGVQFAPTYELIHATDGSDCTLQYMLPIPVAMRKEFEQHVPAEDGTTDFDSRSSFPRDRTPVYMCKAGLNGFLIDYEGRLSPCMNLRHMGRRVDAESFDEIWASFAALHDLMRDPNRPCLDCPDRTFCEVCPGEMDLLHHDPEAVEPERCACVAARRAFYGEKKSIEEALRPVIAACSRERSE